MVLTIQTAMIMCCDVIQNTNTIKISFHWQFRLYFTILTSQLRTTDLNLGADLTPNPLQRFGFFATPSFLPFLPFSCQCDQLFFITLNVLGSCPLVVHSEQEWATLTNSLHSL